MQVHDSARPHEAMGVALSLLRELSRERRDDSELGVTSARRGWCTISVHNLVPGKRARKQAQNIYTDGTLDEMRSMLMQDVGSDEEEAAAMDSDLSDDEFSSDDEGSQDSSSCSGSDSHSEAETEAETEAEEEAEASDQDPDYTPDSSDTEAEEGTTTDGSSDEEPEFEDTGGSEDDAMDVDEPSSAALSPAPMAADEAAADEAMEPLFLWFGGLEIHTGEWIDFTSQDTEDRWRTRPKDQKNSNFFLSWAAAQRAGEREERA